MVIQICAKKVCCIWDIPYLKKFPTSSSTSQVIIKICWIASIRHWWKFVQEIARSGSR